MMRDKRGRFMKGMKKEEHPLYGKHLSKERIDKLKGNTYGRGNKGKKRIDLVKFNYLRRGKSYEEISGEEMASQRKKKLSIALTRRNLEDNPAKRLGVGNKISERNKELFKLGIRKPSKGMLGKKQTEKFKEMRKNQIFPIKDTSIEVKIQNFLKQLRIDFFTHQHIKIKHSYQCDILIPSMNLVIECDGDYWHKYPIGRDIDYIRTSELIEKGFKVLRLWEREINNMNLNKFKGRLEHG